MVSNQGDGDVCWLRSCFGIGNIKADNNCGISRYREKTWIFWMDADIDFTNNIMGLWTPIVVKRIVEMNTFHIIGKD